MNLIWFPCELSPREAAEIIPIRDPTSTTRDEDRRNADYGTEYQRLRGRGIAEGTARILAERFAAAQEKARARGAASLRRH